MRLLCVDPALRNTGYGVIEIKTSGRKPTYEALAYGVIRNDRKLKQSGCLVAIREQIGDIIDQYQPESCAVEGVIFVQSYRTAITLGAARGSAILAAAERGLEVFEYAPKRVKQAIVGKGAAAKGQVAFMVRALLSLSETPPEDAADALAIGLTHCYNTEGNHQTADPPTSI